MKEIFNLKTIKGRVKLLMVKYPTTKDDDKELLLRYQEHFGEVPLSDTITRARRKLQQDDPTFRGKRWYERHNLRTKQMQIELGYNVK
jgi:hypothetical protein